ncbi:hypothetical protein [Campylobacter sp.]|uniref:hypothetical protein n=1 Tax=Campylobacter sp. TaxID=205 RepID=UPI0025B7E5D9|nr:hypothetical protein [Campylobacter sp.]
MSISKELAFELNANGYFNIDNSTNFMQFRDAQPTFTSQNIGMPAGILSQISTEVVSNIVNARNAEKILGDKEKLIDWETEDYWTPLVEKTGVTTPYSDNVMPVYAGMNIDFNRVSHYRFTCAYRYENLKAAKVAKAKINYSDLILGAVTEAMAVELNRTAFDGYLENSGNGFLCFGLLNNPQLDNYETASKTFQAMTWEEILAFFAGAYEKLGAKSGGHITNESKVKCAVSNRAFSYLLSKRTALGINVFTEIKNTFPGIEFVPAVELDNANNNQNVIYFIGSNQAGGVLPTSKIGYSELALMSNTELSYFGYSQAMAAGTLGTLIYKPLFVMRYTNI